MAATRASTRASSPSPWLRLACGRNKLQSSKGILRRNEVTTLSARTVSPSIPFTHSLLLPVARQAATAAAALENASFPRVRRISHARASADVFSGEDSRRQLHRASLCQREAVPYTYIQTWEARFWRGLLVSC